ncbi:unnamed protein product [Prunus brigantina]
MTIGPYIFCSPNTDREIARQIAAINGSPLTNSLGSYLGVPLIHSRVNKDTYSHVVTKVQQRLTSWKSLTLSMAGRLRRNLTTDPNCHRCRFLPKTMEHMFKDCQHAQQVWNSIEIPHAMAHTVSLSFDVWVMINLKSKIKVSHNLP